MDNKIEAIFLKPRFYNNKFYKNKEIVKMNKKDFDFYYYLSIVDFNIKHTKNEIDLNELSYRDLQKKCKDKNIIAVGTKEELLNNLKKSGGV